MTLEEVKAHFAKRDALLETLTPGQRRAVYDWLKDENDYGDMLASWQWAAAWIGNPGEL